MIFNTIMLYNLSISIFWKREYEIFACFSNVSWEYLLAYRGVLEHQEMFLEINSTKRTSFVDFQPVFSTATVENMSTRETFYAFIYIKLT